MNAGIGVDENVLKIFTEQLKTNPTKIQGMIMQLGVNGYELVKSFEKGYDYDELVKDNTYFPKDDAR